MKRFHVHVSVPDLSSAVRFYSTMFGAEPAVLKPDYAKWSLEEPRVNFAVSQGQVASTGIDHLGIELDSSAALAEQAETLRAAGADVLDQPAARCCYASGDKAWVFDTAGVRWETFHTTGEIPVYGEDRPSEGAGETASACCPTAAPAKASACCPTP